MTKLTYVTGNIHKKEELAFFFRDEPHIQIEIIDPSFKVLEIQASSCADVAAFSAKYAADKLGVPCLKSDSGLYIDCLGGLPGPYNAHFDKQIGTEKFLELMKGQINRTARLEHSFAYCEPGKEPVVFSGGSTGIIASKATGKSGRWHDQFYIPDGETETLSELRDRDKTYEQQFWGTALPEFAAWYKKNVVQDS